MSSPDQFGRDEQGRNSPPTPASSDVSPAGKRSSFEGFMSRQPRRASHESADLSPSLTSDDDRYSPKNRLPPYGGDSSDMSPDQPPRRPPPRKASPAVMVSSPFSNSDSFTSPEVSPGGAPPRPLG